MTTDERAKLRAKLPVLRGISLEERVEMLVQRADRDLELLQGMSAEERGRCSAPTPMRRGKADDR